MMRNVPSIDLRRKEVRPGDFKEALWVQYMNTINSFNTLESTSVSVQGSQKFETTPSWNKFEGNVKVLYALLKGRGLIDDEFKKKAYEKESEDEEWAVTFLSAETDLLQRKVFAEKTEDWGMV